MTDCPAYSWQEAGPIEALRMQSPRSRPRSQLGCEPPGFPRPPQPWRPAIDAKRGTGRTLQACAAWPWESVQARSPEPSPPGLSALLYCSLSQSREVFSESPPGQVSVLSHQEPRPQEQQKSSAPLPSSVLGPSNTQPLLMETTGPTISQSFYCHPTAWRP